MTDTRKSDCIKHREMEKLTNNESKKGTKRNVNDLSMDEFVAECKKARVAAENAFDQMFKKWNMEDKELAARSEKIETQEQDKKEQKVEAEVPEPAEPSDSFDFDDDDDDIYNCPHNCSCVGYSSSRR